ncbi:MAG: hypothetical protein NTW01_05685 [Gammaproteobacteria bacterium]|jgi:hypothetical protein|nr:hypothetical protein [Gammaproteobacteria bacterium]
MPGRWREWLFLAGYGLLATHELDAVLRAEWRVLPGLSMLDEALARPLFIGLHVPLFALLTGWIGSAEAGIRQRARHGICLFLVVHAGLHLLFGGHRHYDFHEAGSRLLIFAGALCGLGWLAWPAAPASAADQKL